MAGNVLTLTDSNFGAEVKKGVVLEITSGETRRNETLKAGE